MILMFFELVLAILLGCVMGVATGITPGLHINLVSVMLLSAAPFLLGYTNVIALASLIISMSVTHTFTDFISSTYLGAPNEDTALSVLPAHKLLLNGMGHEAVRLTLIGSLLGLIIAISLCPLLIIAVPVIFSLLKDYIWLVLTLLLIFMILKEKGLDKKFWNMILILLAGILGLIVLGIPNLKEPLLPMLSGLFGASVLILSLTQSAELPVQRTTEMISVGGKRIAKSMAGAVFSGSLVSIFPGLGPAQAGVISSQMAGKTDGRDYLILVGGINTVSMILSLVTLFSIEKARNGSIVVVQRLVPHPSLHMFVLFLAAALLAGGVATFLTLFTSRIFSGLINLINYSFLSVAIILFVSSMVFLFSGWIGMLIFAVSTAIGLIPNILNIDRSNLMACLIVPIIMFNVL